MALPAQVNIAAANIEQSLYVVPGGTSATVRIIVVNRNASAATFRVAHVPGGGSSGLANYLAFDRDLDSNREVMSTILDMNAGDEIRVESNSLNITFQAQGIERT